jgi:phosphatidylglycerol---prolipoprotein diacylglyceryl transferase
MFSRCYPTLSDFILHTTGIDIPLPVFSFGFFVALGFLAAAMILSSELQRKEKLGWINPFEKEILVGAPATAAELILNGLLGFVLGYKLLDIVLNYSTFSQNPQEALLSLNGNFLGGIAGAALLAYLKYREKEQQKLDTPKTEKITVHPHELTGCQGFLPV